MPDNAPHNTTREDTMSTDTTFTIGQRVELHPATDAWMSGDRYGEIVKVTSLYHVKMDKSGYVRKLTAELLTAV